MSDIRNWVRYRQGKAKYTQVHFTDRVRQKWTLQSFDKFQFIYKKLYFGTVYQFSIIFDMSEIIIKISALQPLKSKIYADFTHKEATFAHLSLFMFVNIYFSLVIVKRLTETCRRVNEQASSVI
jgi:hypothetical protein